jgi:nucleoside-diphosphate-sugar epimerase
LYQTTEASYLGEAMTWIATTRQCANEAYNVTNGDTFRWEQLWPELARFFGVAQGPVDTLDLIQFIEENAQTWESIREKHQLQDYRLSELASGKFGNWVYSTDYDIVSSTTKLRQAGWHKMVDSEAMYPRLLAELRAQRIIP